MACCSQLLHNNLTPYFGHQAKEVGEYISISQHISDMYVAHPLLVIRALEE